MLPAMPGQALPGENRCLPWQAAGCIDRSLLTCLTWIGLCGQQQAVDELRARLQNAEAETQRLRAEVERLRISGSAQATA